MTLKMSPLSLEVSLRHLGLYIQLFPQQIHLDISYIFKFNTYVENWATDRPPTNLAHPVLLISVVPVASTKSLRWPGSLSLPSLSHTFHTQFNSKSYQLYFQNRYQIQLLLTTSTATILAQATILSHLDKCNSQSDLPASTFIINSKLSSQSALVQVQVGPYHSSAQNLSKNPHMTHSEIQSLLRPRRRDLSSTSSFHLHLRHFSLPQSATIPLVPCCFWDTPSMTLPQGPCTCYSLCLECSSKIPAQLILSPSFCLYSNITFSVRPSLATPKSNPKTSYPFLALLFSLVLVTTMSYALFFMFIMNAPIRT